ncbi:hypothetical protein GH714_031968 [Hevea brasiliensis]|uniref:DUF4219 domain-containing protein n=1 Tax=Hevea brasiliensis TaxID=3981 RepID=A0A6A6KJV7_HEVBR|nr:hypothetical protein GH714_031968 [Hevea brasiliensis]
MASSGYSTPTPPVFSREGYAIWAIKMKAYLKAFNLWEVTETGRQPGPLREDPTFAQIKAHSEECAKGFKVLSCMLLFLRIVTVQKKAIHFVRLRFCDILSQSPGRWKFDLYIYTKFRQVIDFENFSSSLASPKFMDFVVQPDDSGHIKFSICPRNDSDDKVAFLNGLEIMEFVTDTRMKFDHFENPSRKCLDLIIGFSVGGVVPISILIILFLFGVRCRKAKLFQAVLVKDEVPPGEEGFTVG